MALLELPSELRLRIYEYLPCLQHDTPARVSNEQIPITPAICRVNRQLRLEALPLYAKTAYFCIDLGSPDSSSRDRLGIWATTLQPWLQHVRIFRLMRHWESQGRSDSKNDVGFYLNLHKITLPYEHPERWSCTSGTHPTPNDLRGMRLESAELLQSRIDAVLNRHDSIGGFDRARLELIISAIDVVAAHPVSLYDLDQSDAGRRRRRQTWERMARRLQVLTGNSMTGVSFTSY
ncbi:hypothetical protein K431DRAFT_224624 [Polychaeton citri CBS 116435]|uniref:F-box domain-containing protein n=1 Tax=Polychaeton citri CBS 116435 TaxID=1314669 RepID=A0A9P4QAI7_9PEZI|nr:hypothetical protein K431DRAFT_224624 [Polychaeton citri CBS 116435]